MVLFCAIFLALPADFCPKSSYSFSLSKYALDQTLFGSAQAKFLAATGIIESSSL
jgi:hypothetical protein